MPKRRIAGNHPRRLTPAARQRYRDQFESAELRNLPPTEIEQRRERHQLDPYAPQFGDTVVLAVPMACASCPTEIAEGAEATYIDGELNCTECTWEARHPNG